MLSCSTLHAQKSCFCLFDSSPPKKGAARIAVLATWAYVLCVSTNIIRTQVGNPSVKNEPPFPHGASSCHCVRAFPMPVIHSPDHAVSPGSGKGCGGNVCRRGLRAHQERVRESSQHHPRIFFHVSQIAKLSKPISRRLSRGLNKLAGHRPLELRVSGRHH